MYRRIYLHPATLSNPSGPSTLVTLKTETQYYVATSAERTELPNNSSDPVTRNGTFKEELKTGWNRGAMVYPQMVWVLVMRGRHQRLEVVFLGNLGAVTVH